FGYWAVDVTIGQSHVPGPWQNIGGPQTVNMGSSALVGLALTAHNNGRLAQAVFRHVPVTQVSPTTALGAPTGLTVAHVAPYKSLSEVIISWHPGSDNESGFKVERSTDGISFNQIGTAPAGATTFTDNNPVMGLAPGTYYYRVKAFAAGQPDSGYSNVDSVRYALPGTPLTITHGFATFGDITTNGSANIFPKPAPVGTFLGHQDIDGVVAPGGATFDAPSGTYTVKTSSFDIWDVSDSFHYVYKPLNGDGEIVARAVNIQPTDFWTKPGVMIRETLRPNSKNAFMLETANLDGFFNNQPIFQWRSDTGGTTSDAETGFGTQKAPVWLRLKRSGNSFTGYYAVDINNGASHGAWIQVGSPQTVTMASTVYVGLALTGQGGKTN